jgi:hypothetical protein
MIQEINKTLNKKHVDLILNMFSNVESIKASDDNDIYLIDLKYRIFESTLKIFIKDNEIDNIALLSSDVS